MATSNKELTKVLDKVGKLVKLAQADDESEESRTAAIQACGLMKEHELVLVPMSEIQRAQSMLAEARELARKSEGEVNQKMMIAGIAGMMLGKGGLFK